MLADFIISTAILFLFFQGALAASPGSEIDVFKRSLDAQHLYPLGRRASGFEARDTLRRSLHPQTEVVLSYGEDFHPNQQQVFVLDITLVYHDSAPVLLLEDFEALISSITCSADLITISFFDDSDFDYARDAWSALEGFTLISNHPESNCNPTHERSAYMVKEIQWDRLKSAVQILAEPVALLKTARRFSVDFGHITQEQYHRTLTRRQTTTQDIQDDEDDHILNFHPNGTIELHTSFPPRNVLWPLSSDVSIDGGNNGESPLDVQVTCIDCSVDGELTFRGHFDQDITGLEWAWVEVEVTKAIKSQLKLEFYLSLESKEWEIKLLPTISLSPFQIPKVLSIGPEFDYSLVTDLSLGNAAFNFTYGVTVEIPINSIARFDFKEPGGNDSYAKGWYVLNRGLILNLGLLGLILALVYVYRDKIDVKQIPFTINSIDGNLALSLNVTTKPSVGFKVTILSGDATTGPSIDFAAPRLLVTAEELNNVTANCSQLGSNDYEYYEDAFKFSTTWELGVSISVDATVDLPILPAIGASFSADLATYSFPTDSTCRVLSGGTKTGELKSASSVTPQLDIAKIESVVQSTGSLPPGVDPDLLATYPGLPTSVTNAIEAAKNGAANFQPMGRVGILSVLIGVAVLAIMI